MLYMLKADESAPRDETQTASVATTSHAVKPIVPRAGIAKGLRLDESSLDLHHGLEVSEGEVDTVPDELPKDLFKL